MVTRVPAPLRLVPGHKREVNHPAESENPGILQAQTLAQRLAKARERGENDAWFVSYEEQEITGLGPESSDDFLQTLFRDKPGEGRTGLPRRVECEVGQTLGAEGRGELGELVQGAPTVSRAALGVQPPHMSAGGCHTLKDLKTGTGGQIGDIPQLETEADVGAVFAV